MTDCYIVECSKLWSRWMRILHACIDQCCITGDKSIWQINSILLWLYEYLFNQEIDGRAFLLLTCDTMMKYMNLKLGPAIKIANIVEQLNRRHWQPLCINMVPESLFLEVWTITQHSCVSLHTQCPWPFKRNFPLFLLQCCKKSCEWFLNVRRKFLLFSIILNAVNFIQLTKLP